MRKLLAYWRLLRPFNLLLIAVTPVAIWVVLVTPQLGIPVLNLRQVVALGIAIALVAGGGNVVNDIADRTIDKLNGRPNPLIDQLSATQAWGVYGALNLTAVVLTWQLAGELDMWLYALLLPLAILALVVYAFALKCRPWLGNLVVACFCAGVPGIILLAEPLMLDGLRASPLSQSLLGYVIIAFSATWARELIKDLEDREGDAAAGCRHLAVRWSVEGVLRVVYVMLFVTLAAVAYVATLWARTDAHINAASWAVLWLLLASITAQIKPSLSKVELGQVSRNLKMVIAFGLALLVLLGANL